MKRGISILLTICMILALIPDKAAASETAAFSEPNVTALTVSYDGGETQNLLENQSAILLPAGSKPVFTVTFDNSEPLNRVFVTSTKNGETKYLEAKPQGGQYVTDDYFDPNDVNYIPGTISVTYSKKTVKVGESGGTDLNTLKAQLSSQGISSRNETTEADGTVTAQVVLGDMFGAMANECFDAAVSEFTVGAGIDQGELDRWLGVYQNLSELSSYDLEGVDGKQYTLYLSDKDFGDTDTYLVMVKDATSNKYTKMLLNKAAGSVGLGDIFDALSAANVVSKKLLEYRAISKDTAALREEIEAHPTMTRQEKAEANAEADAWDRDRKLFLIGMTAVAILVPPASAPLMISVLTAGYSAIADYFWDYRVGMIKGCGSIEGVFSDSTEHEGSWIPLTQEYLDEHNNFIDKNGNYYLAEDISLIGLGNREFPLTNVTICLHGHNVAYGISTGSEMSCSWHLYDCKYSEKQDGTVNGGKVFGRVGEAIANGNNSNLRIDNCIIAGPVVNDTGTITIAGGMFTDGGGGNVYSISNLSGTINITGGTIVYDTPYTGCISNAGSMVYGGASGTATLNISGGVILNTADRSCCIDNYADGTVNISGGTIENAGINNSSAIENAGIVAIDGGSISTSVASLTATCIDNSATGTLFVRGGTLKAIGHISAIHNNGVTRIEDGEIFGDLLAIGNGGEMAILGGKIEASGLYDKYRGSSIGNTGNLTVEGGIIKCANGEGVSNSGVLSVSGGTIIGNSGILNRNNAFISGNTLIVTTVEAGVGVINSGGTLTISGCRISAHNVGVQNSGNVFASTTTLKIKEDSIIEIDAIIPFAEMPIVLADESYTGCVTYYDTPDATGIKKTILEATNIEYTLAGYMCLVADGATGGPSGGDISDCTHTYVSIVSDPTCTSTGYTTHICTKCGDSYQDNYTDALGHSYGTWNTIQSATPTAPGLQERICSRCGDRETRIIPATGESGGNSGGSGNHSSDKDSDPGPSYPVNEPKTENGSLSISPQNAVSGAIVTVTVKPDAGYELDTLTVTNKGGRQVRVTSKGNGQYTFRMPGSEAEIRATFKPIVSSAPAAAGTFSDVPTDHWAGTEISWVLENSVMNGVGDGKFNPDGTVTRQQLWMTLARMAGEAPADMAAAKIWAVNNSISDGSVPGNTITRQQMAVILHRFAKLTGHSVSGSGDLSRYSDSGEISSYAREAMAWAVGSGILNGTADGALNPNGTATRAQIAVILHRFYSRVIHA